MANRNKARGTFFETAVLNYLKDRGFGKVYRTPQAGIYDTGDINGITSGSAEVIIQCKNRKEFDLSGWLNDTVAQADVRAKQLDPNMAVPVNGALIVKRPKVGEKTLGETYVVMRLEDFVDILKEANYS